MLREILTNFGAILCDVLNLAIFIQILISWTMGMNNRGYALLNSITSPVMKLARKIAPPVGMLDFSPMVAMFALEVIKNIWTYLMMYI